MIKDNKKWLINEVLDKVKIGQSCDKPIRIKFDKDLVKINSQRLQTFKLSGIKCCKCGIEGKYFRKDKFLGSDYYHFNLYALDSNKNEILMTKDHITPKSKGGKNTLKNYQTLCVKCNQKKGNKLKKEGKIMNKLNGVYSPTNTIIGFIPQINKINNKKYNNLGDI